MVYKKEGYKIIAKDCILLVIICKKKCHVFYISCICYKNAEKSLRSRFSYITSEKIFMTLSMKSLLDCEAVLQKS